MEGRGGSLGLSQRMEDGRGEQNSERPDGSLGTIHAWRMAWWWAERRWAPGSGIISICFANVAVCAGSGSVPLLPR